MKTFIRHLNVISCKLNYVMWRICIISPRNYSLWNNIIPCMFKRRLNVIIKFNPDYVLLPICIVRWWNNSMHIRACLQCYHSENCCFFQCKVSRGMKTHVPKLLSSSLWVMVMCSVYTMWQVVIGYLFIYTCRDVRNPYDRSESHAVYIGTCCGISRIIWWKLLMNT